MRQSTRDAAVTDKARRHSEMRKLYRCLAPGTRSRGNQIACVRTDGGSLGENTQQPVGCLIHLTEIAASNRNNIVRFKGGKQFTNKGARALRDVLWGGRQTGNLPIYLFGSQALIIKSFAGFNFDSALRVRVLPHGTSPPLTVAGFAVGDSLDVEDGVAAHPKTNPTRNHRLKVLLHMHTAACVCHNTVQSTRAII
jgi:hypothetical protein